MKVKSILYLNNIKKGDTITISSRRTLRIVKIGDSFVEGDCIENGCRYKVDKLLLKDRVIL